MNYKIFYSDIDLPFFSTLENSTSTDDDDDDEEYDDEDDSELERAEQLEKFQELIPDYVISIGVIGDEIDHSPGLSWDIEEHFYLIPGNSDEFDWGLFRIHWDDNWGRYEYCTDAVIKGIKDPRIASRKLVEFMFSEWSYDLNDEDNEVYKNFLESI
jgi:hypothetical protein